MQHPITVYTGNDVLAGHVDKPEQSRLLDWISGQTPALAINDVTVSCPSTTGGHEVSQIILNADVIDAIVDEGEHHADPSLVMRRMRARVQIMLRSGLCVTGDLHLPEGAAWQNLVLNSDETLRPLTDATIGFPGAPRRAGAAVLVRLSRCAYLHDAIEAPALPVLRDIRAPGPVLPATRDIRAVAPIRLLARAGRPRRGMARAVRSRVGVSSARSLRPA